MKPLRTLLAVLVPALVIFIGIPQFVRADTAINFDVEGPSGPVFNGYVSVPSCATPSNATSTINGFCAFAEAGLTVNATSTPSGTVVNSINATTGNWQWFLNGSYQSQAIDSYTPQTNDSILWALGREPLQINISTTSPAVNATTTVTVLGFNPANSDFEPIPNATIVGTSLITDTNGTAAIVATSTTPLIISVTANGFISSGQFTITPQAESPLHKIILSATSVTAGTPFTATAQEFNASSSTYQALTGVTLGVGSLSSSSSFTEIATSTVDSSGQAIFTISATGTLAVGIKEDGYSTTVPITITDAASTPPSGGGGGGISHPTFNIQSALAFISGMQNSDGSFESASTTDWTAVAFGATNPGSAKTKLTNYLLNVTPTFSSILDDERHAMALEAMGINPYSGTSVNYITPITTAFDGSQIGTLADTDDIFGLLVLEHAGFTSSDTIIQKDAAFVLSTQHPDGSWDETPNMTAAAIQALGPLFDINGVNAALGESAGYLASTEMTNGSWGAIDSTSWVQTAINGIIQAQTPGFTTENPWTTSAGFLPTDAIASTQQPDGGVQSADRELSTSYAITAASGQSWDSILQSFPKPSSPVGGGGSPVVGGTGEVLGTSTTNSLITASPTTTPETATSTQPITIVLTVPAISKPTTTPVALPKPTLRPYKRLAKIKKPINTTVQKVTIEPTPDTSQTQSAPPAAPNGNGFLGNFWHSITSFFRRIF